MHVLKNTSIALLTLTILSGCAQVNDSLKAINSTLASATNTLKSPLQTTDKTVAQICSEAQRNPTRANQEFGGLGLSVTGVVRLHDSYGIGEDFFMLKSGSNSVAVSGYPEMVSLNDGQRLQVKGTISNISKDFGCLISIKNAT
ncbi:TPA: hypothetical protein MYL90_002513 [Klebsiella pneumoniae]|nr:hypothetical protein [Klebsiella pneumoniae]